MPETAPKGCHIAAMNDVPWSDPENPQQLFILREIFILRGDVTTPYPKKCTTSSIILCMIGSSHGRRSLGRFCFDFLGVNIYSRNVMGLGPYVVCKWREFGSSNNIMGHAITAYPWFPMPFNTYQTEPWCGQNRFWKRWPIVDGGKNMGVSSELITSG